MHARQQIREAVAGLVAGLTTTGANVFQSRVYNLQESELPGLLVYTTTETDSEPQSIGYPRRMLRVVEVVVEGKAQATANLDDTLDTISEEVEVALGADPALGLAAAIDTVHAGTDIELSGDADQPIGSVTMRFNVAYMVTEDAPGTIL